MSNICQRNELLMRRRIGGTRIRKMHVVGTVSEYIAEYF